MIRGYGHFIVVASFAAALVGSAPLRTAFQFGGDEGYELMKGFLCSRGFSLYQQIWNDQPPLHTALLAGLFKLFGPSAYAGRLLTVALASLLVWALYQSVSRQAGQIAALVSALLLLSSPHFFQLSVSVMIELPAMALSLAGTLAFFVFLENGRTFWLVLSGGLMGCALQIKLTAAIFFPALFVQWFVARHRLKSANQSPVTSAPSASVGTVKRGLAALGI